MKKYVNKLKIKVWTQVKAVKMEFKVLCRGKINPKAFVAILILTVIDL